MKESLPAEKRNTTVEINILKRLNILSGLKVITNPFIRALTGIRFLFAFAFGTFTTLLALVLREKYGFDSSSLGIFYSFVGMYLIINQYFVVGYVAKRLGTMRAHAVGIYIWVAALCVFPFIPNQFVVEFPYSDWIYLFIFPFFFGLGSSLAVTTFKTLLLDNVNKKDQGQASGLESSMVALATGISPLFAGFAYSTFGIFTISALAIVLVITFVSTRLYFHTHCRMVRQRQGIHPTIIGSR
jgi:predicted MFS family arabinose efflux permease